LEESKTMRLPIFKLENYFSQWEFKARYLLCASDSESWSQKEILAMSDSESLQLWDTLSLAYTETHGRPVLREEIAKQYSKMQASDILTTAGAEEGIFVALQTLISPNDHVIAITPCYQSFVSIPQSIGARVSTIALEESQGWKLDIEKLQAAVTKTTKLIVLNFPHNPTGALIDKETLMSVIDLARKHGLYIVSDEVYRLLEFDATKRLPQVADIYEKGISINVMTKAFGLGGLRVGWLASQDHQFIKQAEQTKHYLSIANSGPSEILSLMALRSKETILTRNRSIISANFATLSTFFATYAQLFSWQAPVAGCIGFVKLATHIDGSTFFKELVEEEGVLLLPGSIYDYSDSYFRVGFGRKNMPEALGRLEHFIQKKKMV
jgi:aspartate/methionine/tyrosine aminotransferase